MGGRNKKVVRRESLMVMIGVKLWNWNRLLISVGCGGNMRRLLNI